MLHHQTFQWSSHLSEGILLIIFKHFQESIHDVVYLISIHLCFCRILSSWVGEIFQIIIWHLKNVGFGCATLCHTGFLSVSVTHDALNADLMWGAQSCGLHKSKVQNEIFGAKPQLLKVLGCMCTLIFTDSTVTFVNPTNQNLGFTINVQFLNKVGRACWQDQRNWWVSNWCGPLPVQDMGET